MIICPFRWSRYNGGKMRSFIINITACAMIVGFGDKSLADPEIWISPNPAIKTVDGKTYRGLTDVKKLFEEPNNWKITLASIKGFNLVTDIEQYGIDTSYVQSTLQPFFKTHPMKFILGEFPFEDRSRKYQADSSIDDLERRRDSEFPCSISSFPGAIKDYTTLFTRVA